MPLKEALRRTRLDCRAVRRFLVAASGSAACAPRLPRRAKIWRRSYNFDIALSAEEKRLLNDMACARMIRCCQVARLVKAFAARYRLHHADPALSCVVIFDRAVAVDCVHVSVIRL